MSKEYWVAEVKYTDEYKLESHPHLHACDMKVFNRPVFIGPFDEYDSGIKVWSAEFSAKYQGKFEYIDYHKLITP